MKYLRAVLNETLRLFPPGAKEPSLCDTARFQFLSQSLSTCEKRLARQHGSTMRAERSMFLPTRGECITRILTFPISSCVFRLGFSIIHLQRHEEYWGPDAHIFDPDRWLDFRVKRYTSNPSIFLAFNGGPRIVRPDIFDTDL